MGECKKQTGKIPVIYAKGLFKVFICVNEFNLAYSLVSTVLADMQQNNVDAQEINLYKQYFLSLVALAVEVADNNDFTHVKSFAANYSGSSNYTLVKSTDEIRENLKIIRERFRQFYGQ